MAQDYNIFIHSDLSTASKPTTPKQLRPKGANGESDKGTNIAGAISKVGSFIQNPDSAISAVMGKGVGAIASAGVVGAIIVVAAKVIFGTADKVITTYNNYASSASGDYARAITYNNFKQALTNTLHPVSTEISRQQAQLQIKKQNAINEQQQLLTGGTILNSEYGRYL